MKKRITAMILAAVLLTGCAAGSFEKNTLTAKSLAAENIPSREAVITTLSATKSTGYGVLGYDLSDAASTSAKNAGGNVSDIIINEICAKNKSSLKDSYGKYPDWVELYNPSSKAVNLKGCGLSDDASKPLKWKFPSVNIQPKGYLVVFCSDKNTVTKELHTNFKIADGDKIILSDSSGKTVDSVTAVNTSDDETYGVSKSGKFMILSATPGASNDTAKTKDLGVLAPEFSKTNGFYEQSFKLTLTAPAGTTVYYTTDGSVPTKSSKKYTAPFTVKDRSSEKAVLIYKKGTIADRATEQFPSEEFEKATVVRAIAVDKSGKSSPVASATYFVGKDIAEKYKNVPVVSVITDPVNLYDPAKGIFVAGNAFTQWLRQPAQGRQDEGTFAPSRAVHQRKSHRYPLRHVMNRHSECHGEGCFCVFKRRRHRSHTFREIVQRHSDGKEESASAHVFIAGELPRCAHMFQL